MAGQMIQSVNEFVAGAENPAQEPVSQGSDAAVAPTQGAAPSASVPAEQPVQKAIPLHDKAIYKAPPSAMPSVLFDAPSGPPQPPHIGSRPQMTDPSMHPSHVMRPLSLPNVPRPGMEYTWEVPTPPMSQLQPRAPDLCAQFTGSAPPPGQVPSRAVPLVTPGVQAPPPWPSR